MLESPFVRGVVEFAASTAAFVRIDTQDLYDALMRHAAHDWGDVSPEVREHNEAALKDGGRLYAQYADRRGVTFYVTSGGSERMPRVSLTKDA